MRNHRAPYDSRCCEHARCFTPFLIASKSTLAPQGHSPGSNSHVVEVWKHVEEGKSVVCRKSLVCSHTQALYWNAKEAKLQSRLRSSAWLRKAPASGSQCGFWDVLRVLSWLWFHVGIRDVPLSCSGEGGSPFADWAVFAPWSQLLRWSCEDLVI